MTDPLHTEPVEVTQLRVASDRCYPGLHYIEGAPFRISFWTIATNIDPVEGVRRLRFADELVAAWNTRTAAEAESRAREARLREALAETREMLGLCEQIICDETCPTTWRTADGQPHGQMHKDICDVLARHEHHIHPARVALSPAAKEALMGERVLVCGGRDYSDQATAFGVLDMLAEQGPINTIIQGGANGADKLARMWAITRNCHFDEYPADWRAHGRAAGPIRNQQMLEEARPTLVVAFPGGRGTADMVRRAKAAGVKIMEVPA